MQMFLNFIVYLLFFLFGNNKYFDLQNLLCENNLIVPDAWTIYGGTDNLNIAFPDVSARYRGSFFCLKSNETLVLKSDVPHARYYSIQVYDSTTSSLGSLNDYQIDTKDGKFFINIVKSENSNGVINNTLHISTNDSFLILIFRVYDVPDINELKISPKGKSESFGWISPPNLYKVDFQNKIINITNSPKYANVVFPRIYRNIDPIKKSMYDNMKNNFFKPHSRGYFSNDDANYLISTINLTNFTNSINSTNSTNSTKMIGAIVRGYLPKTDINRVNYFKTNDKVCRIISTDHRDYHEVRYVSFNMGTTIMPFPTIAGPQLKTYRNISVNSRDISSTGKPGIIDTDIVNRYGNATSWHEAGRPYTIYIGANVSHIEKMGANISTDLYMIYPTHYDTGELFNNPVIVFRHLMSHDKFMKNPIFKYGIGSINKSFATPLECSNVMQKYYPTIDFIYV